MPGKRERKVLDAIEIEVHGLTSRTLSGVTAAPPSPHLHHDQGKADLGHFNGVSELAVRVVGGADQHTEATRSAVEHERAVVAKTK